MSRKPGPERQAEIVAAMLSLLETTPIERLSTAMIAAKVGFSQAALFRHFPTKGALWAAVLAEIESRAINRWDDAQHSGATPIERLQGILMAQLALFAQTPAIPALIFTTGRIEAEQQTRPIHLRMLTTLHDRLRTQIDAAIADGHLTHRVPAGDIPLLLMGLIQGLALRWALVGQQFDLCHEGARLITLQIDLLTPRTEDLT